MRNEIGFKESPFLSKLNTWVLNKSTPTYGEFTNIVEYISLLEKKFFELENKGIEKDG